MRLKRLVSACLVLCITAILWIAVCGCEDLGAYENTEEYYASLGGDVTLINATTKESKPFSIKDYFYNEDSKENFLEGKDKVPYGEYVYMAIYVENGIEMDSLALYLNSQEDVSVYINVYVSKNIPKNFRPIEDNVINQPNTNGTTDGTSGGTSDDTAGGTSDGTSDGTSNGTTDNTNGEQSYDDPSPDSRIGDVVVHLKAGKWDSFVLDSFIVDGTVKKSIKIEKEHYIILQIRNNSGIRDFVNNVFVDKQTGIELKKAKITMTNLLVRALEVNEPNKKEN